MSKGLETFYRFIDDIEQCFASGGIHRPRIEDKELIEKELKALEIITTKKVNCSHLFGETLDYYNSTWDFDGGEKYQLTQEEYDLLKEVFKK